MDQSIILELNFCYQLEQKQNEQIQDHSVLVRGSNNLNVNRILAKQNFLTDECHWRRPPSLSLCIEHIYGVLCSDKRNTVMYTHSTAYKERKNMDRLELRIEVSK